MNELRCIIQICEQMMELQNMEKTLIEGKDIGRKQPIYQGKQESV
jgi:hypothetical protein